MSFDGTAFLSDSRLAAVRLQTLSRQISALEEDMADCWPTHGGNGPQGRSQGLSDPTYRGMLSLESRHRRLEWLESERQACRDRVDECRAVLAGMAEALGRPVAETCRLYYLDGAPSGIGWADVARETGVTERTALRRRSVAVDWLSDVGLAHARAGDLTRGHEG